MGFGTASLFAKLALVFSLIALIFHIIGFATDYWINYDDYHPLIGGSHYGLWNACDRFNVCSRIATGTRMGTYHAMDRWDATRAMECIGLILGIINLIIVAMYIFWAPASKRKLFWLIGVATAFLATLFILIGVIIFGATWDTDLSWSFALCIIGAIIYFVVGIVLVLDRKNIVLAS